jgi:hypothetical protein
VFEWLDKHIEVTGKQSNVVVIHDMYLLFKKTGSLHTAAEFRVLCKAHLSTFKGVTKELDLDKMAVFVQTAIDTITSIDVDEYYLGRYEVARLQEILL